jgi:hypothetical protein
LIHFNLLFALEHEKEKSIFSKQVFFKTLVLFLPFRFKFSLITSTIFLLLEESRMDIQLVQEQILDAVNQVHEFELPFLQFVLNSHSFIATQSARYA